MHSMKQRRIYPLLARNIFMRLWFIRPIYYSFHHRVFNHLQRADFRNRAALHHPSFQLSKTWIYKTALPVFSA